MPKLGLDGVLHWLRRHVLDDVSCGDLLERFVAYSQDACGTKAEDAFAELVRRHGPKVYGVCRRILGDHQLAEDAFQATFVVLSRKARTIQPRSAVGGFLYGVARKAALEAVAVNRRRKETLVSHPPDERSYEPAADDRSVLALLDEEIANLSAAHRAAVVLCEIDGVSRSEAAKQLGIAEGTLSSRLAAARKQLRKRLLKRGVSLSSGMLAALADSAHAAVPLALTVSTSKITPSALAPAVSLIVQGLLKAMLFTKLKTVTTLGVTLCLASSLAMGIVVTRDGLADAQVKPQAPAKRPIESPEQIAVHPVREDKPRADLYGDPLPDGAIARFGTIQLRHDGMDYFVFEPGGKTILSIGADQVLRSWNIGTGQQTRAVKLQSTSGRGATAMLISPDAKMLVAHVQGKLVFWESETGKELRSQPAPKGELRFFQFSPDSKSLAIGTSADPSNRNNLHISFRDLQSGKEREIAPRFNLNAHMFGGDLHFAGDFSPDSKWYVVGAGRAYPVRIFDVETGRVVLQLDCNADSSTFSPDGKRLAVSGVGDPQKDFSENVLRLFELPSGKKISEFPLGLTEKAVEHYDKMVFSPDGKTLACGALHRGVLVDCETGRVIQEFPDPHPWQRIFTPAGKSIAFRDGDRIRIWDLGSSKELHDRPGDFSRSEIRAVSPDGRLLAEAEWYDIKLWDTASGRLLRQLPLSWAMRDSTLRTLEFAADGRTLFGGTRRGALLFWDLAEEKEPRTVQLRNPNESRRVGGFPDLHFRELQISRDSKHVSTLEDFGHGDSTWIKRWESDKGELLSQVKIPGRNLHRAWLADGVTVALSIEKGLTLLDVTSGAVRVRIPGVLSGPVTASFDGRLMVVPRIVGKGKDAQNFVGIWEVATGNEIAVAPTGRLTNAEIAPDNRTLVTADRRFLKLWDLATGKERQRWSVPIAVPGYADPFRLLLFPDGRRATTIMVDGTALVWDLALPKNIAERLYDRAVEKDIAAWWTDLIEKDAARAYAAVWRLAEAPEAMVIGFLRTRLKPGAELDAKLIRQWVADLDTGDFKVRENAAQHLEQLGRAALPFVHEGLARNPGLEAKRRLDILFPRLQDLPYSPEILRRLRALQVLEQIDSQESRRLLADLAKGMSYADETIEAQRALQRLAPRTFTR